MPNTMQYAQQHYGLTVPTHANEMHHSMHFGMKRFHYCMECGNPLYSGMNYCLECGTMAGSASKDVSGSNSNRGAANPFNSDPNLPPYYYPNQGGSSGAIILIGILILVIAIAIFIGALLFTQGSGNGSGAEELFQDQNESMNDEEFGTESVPIVLNHSYTTDDLTPRGIAYPVFTFEYPNDWTVTDGLLDEECDVVGVEDSFGDVINYVMITDSYSQPYSIRASGINKVADCDLDFGDGGKYIVAQFDIRKSDSSMLPVGSTVLAVLPEEVEQDPTLIDFSTGLPSFKHRYNISFLMVYEKGDILEQRVEQAEAILSSLKYEKEVAASDMSELNREQLNNGNYLDSDYVIPSSSSVRLTEDDLAGFTAYELYLARNEIYARHGREFVNSDLNLYFNSKPWYVPSISPEDFSDSMLSQIERDNLQTILSMERLMSSPYL